MASLGHDVRTGHLVVCFNTRRNGSTEGLYFSLQTTDRTLGTGKRALVHDFVTDVEDASHGAISHVDVRTRIQNPGYSSLRPLGKNAQQGAADRSERNRG